jgi:hypothetical protein
VQSAGAAPPQLFLDGHALAPRRPARQELRKAYSTKKTMGPRSHVPARLDKFRFCGQAGIRYDRRSLPRPMSRDAPVVFGGCVFQGAGSRVSTRDWSADGRIGRQTGHQMSVGGMPAHCDLSFPSDCRAVIGKLVQRLFTAPSAALSVSRTSCSRRDPAGRQPRRRTRARIQKKPQDYLVWTPPRRHIAHAELRPGGRPLQTLPS